MTRGARAQREWGRAVPTDACRVGSSTALSAFVHRGYAPTQPHLYSSSPTSRSKSQPTQVVALPVSSRSEKLDGQWVAVWGEGSRGACVPGMDAVVT